MSYVREAWTDQFDVHIFQKLARHCFETKSVYSMIFEWLKLPSERMKLFNIQALISIVFEANTRNKTDHPIWKGKENSQKICFFTILFEVTLEFLKLRSIECGKIKVTTLVGFYPFFCWTEMIKVKRMNVFSKTHSWGKLKKQTKYICVCAFYGCLFKNVWEKQRKSRSEWP